MRARVSAFGDIQSLSVGLTNAAKAVDKQSLMQALESGGAIIQNAVKTEVGKAKTHPRGQLAESISLQPAAGGDAAVTIGWETNPMRGKGGGRRQRSSGYTDASGRHRKVSTVADYARILEYSAKRQLRHMEPGAAASKDEAEKTVAAIIESKISQAL